MAKGKKVNTSKKPLQTAGGYEESTASSSVNEAAAIYALTMPALKAFDFMDIGAKKNFLTVTNDSDFIGVIRQGIPKKAIDSLIDKTGIPANEMAVLMRLSDRTLRRYNANTLLSPEQSERVVEISRLYSRGQEVFGSLENFKEWMSSTVMALGNIKPKTLLDTSLGIDILMNELGRIEHGIFA